jgi:preprotein translocase SecF subunit
MYFRTRNWNVVGWFKIVSAISTALIVAGLLMMAYNFASKGYPLKLGLSFTGGTDVTAAYTAPVTTQAVRDALAPVGVSDAQITTIGETAPNTSTRFSISTQTAFGNSPDTLWAALGKAGTLDRPHSQIESVGPSLSHEYLVKALLALAIAIGIQFVYIAFRFGWNYIFGAVVVIALLRDALMMIGIYAISGRRADDAFLAAVLTVIGYSVMDTIVILDRIRENVKVMAAEPYDKIVNASILQTMTRSLNTLATVVITLVALLAFGGASLQNFAFALLVGICSGGYHSIFFSAPLVAVLRDRQIKRNARLGRADAAERPRSVAEARSQAAQAKDRAEIIAARKERRIREKNLAQRSPGPARYRKKRTPAEAAAAAAAGTLDEDDYETIDADDHAEGTLHAGDEHGHEHAELDPLDAQRLGLHDQELGHEEIRLTLDDEPPASEVPDHADTPAATTQH